MACLRFLLLLTASIQAKRIALTDSDTPTPLLCTGPNNDPVLWGGADMMRWLHESHTVEIGARGIRFVDSQCTAARTPTEPCESTHMALCETSSGLLFPSAIGDGIMVTGMLNPKLNSSASQQYANAAATACDSTFDGSGIGRTVVMNMAVYTASACDVMQGHLVTIFSAGRVMVVPQTFGPMAYTVVLIATLICIYGASSAAELWSLVVCAAGTLTCCLVYAVSGIPFLTMEDEIHFWFSVASTLLALSLRSPDACVGMLGTIADTLYRSPETPYAAIFVSVLAVRAWQKIRMAASPKGKNNVLNHVDLLFTIIYLCLTAEIGLVPQFADKEDWPIYGGVGTFAAFLIARHA